MIGQPTTLECLDPNQIAKVYQDQYTYVGDMFCGHAGVARSLAKNEVHCRAFDKYTPHGTPKANIKNGDVVQAIIEGIENDEYLGFAIAMPCETVSKARRDDGGPVPLKVNR